MFNPLAIFCFSPAALFLFARRTFGEYPMMNTKLSLLSAAVLLALAGTTAGATQGQPTPKVSAPATHTRGHFTRPLLPYTVLYDQSGVSSINVISQDFGDFSTFSSQLADDFLVTDASGWTVTSVVAQENSSAALNIPGALFNVDIFPDSAGLPGAVAACTYSGLTPSWDVTNTVATIPLSAPCVLAAGTYWLSAVVAQNFSSGGQFYASLEDLGSQFAAGPVWQNPGGAFGGGCPTWTPLATCSDLTATGYTATDAMLFQIVGTTGGGTGGISLIVGLAEDNGIPTQCGTSTNLSATVGDQINFCYTVTNTSAITLNYQSLADTVVGAIFTNMPQTILPGASFQYNRMVTASVTESPTSTWTAQDTLAGYSSSAGAYNFVDISGTGTALGLGDDSSANVTMPFSFNFYGSTSNQLCINNNGHIRFAMAASCSGNYFNAALPYSGFPDPVFMPFWDDLYTAGNVYYTTTGVTPNRQFIVEYLNKDTFDAGGALPGYTFEMILNEADNSIDFDYATVTSGGSALHDGGVSATVGLQGSTTVANQYSFNTASLTDGQNIHWVLSTPTVFTDSKTVTLDVGAPTIFVIPNPLTDTAPAGGSVMTPLYLLNTGNRDLNWTLTEALPASHFPPVPAFTVPFHSPQDTHAGPAPRAQGAAGSKAHPRVPFATGAVPAFAETLSSSPLAYVTFDASAPGTLTPIATFANMFFAGTFANNDFTRENAVDYPAGDLYTIDTTTGAQALIGSTGTPPGSVTGIRWDSSTGNTYLMTTTCGATSTLYTMDLTSGATTSVGSSSGTCIIDIAVDPSGLMYGVDIVADTLVAIDKTTGAAAAIGSIGFNANYAQGMDFDGSTGILYLAGFDGGSFTGNTYTVDLTSGLATLISPIGGGSGFETDAFAIAAAGGPCSSPQDIPWLSESPTSGTATPGLYSTVDVTMDATALTPGPYSATICVNSNDPTNRTIAVPVTFTVTTAVVTDRIFADGFDGP
jgi:hypothetical protein